MSKFDKYFAKALDVQHDIMGDLATVKFNNKSSEMRVIFGEDFGVVNDIQDMFKIACIQKKDMPNFFNDLVIDHDGKRYKADGLFVGNNYESDQYEWCIALREIDRDGSKNRGIKRRY